MVLDWFALPWPSGVTSLAGRKNELLVGRAIGPFCGMSVAPMLVDIVCQ